jgi:hypothetical protein
MPQVVSPIVIPISLLSGARPPRLLSTIFPSPPKAIPKAMMNKPMTPMA